MGAMLLGMGTLHFVAPKPFDSIIPPNCRAARGSTPTPRGSRSWSPAACSGPRTRKLGALAAVALFLAVFPANVNMVRLWRDKPLPMRIGAIARLPLQIPMITQALKIYRNS